MGKDRHKFERVYTVTDHYDGPRGGVADFHGVPHVYRAVWLDTPGLDADDNRFALSPISAAVLVLVLEWWAIWQRFEFALHTGAITVADPVNDKGWGALPSDSVRHRELRRMLEGALTIDPATRSLARGTFRVRQPVPDLPPGVLRPLEVGWRAVE